MENERSPLEVFLLGGSGGLGRAIKQLFTHRNANVDAPARREVNLANLDLVSRRLRSWQRTAPNGVVIYAAGITDIDRCQQQPELSHIVNTLTPLTIAELCRFHGLRFVYFSTDQVLEPCSGFGTHHEDDLPVVKDTMSVYAQHKAWTELQLKSNPMSIVARVQWLYGTKEAWVDQVVQFGRHGRTIEALTDYIGSPTNVHDVADGLWKILQMDRPRRVWHLVAEGRPVSRYALANFLVENLGLSSRVTPNTMANMAGVWKAPRVPNSLLTNHRDPKLRAWPGALLDHINRRETTPQFAPQS